MPAEIPHQRLARYGIKAAVLLLMAATAHADPFTIESGSNVSLQQTLNDAESGLIKAGGTLDTVSDTAVLMPGDFSSLLNSGTIRTTGAVAAGAEATGDDVEMINSGQIATSGFFASGMLARGLRASLVNRGMIATSGVGASAMSSESNFASILNSGQLVTSGFAGVGITSAGASSSIVNTGSIESSGIQGIGISSAEAGASIVNRGSIVVSGPFGIGILLISDDDATAISNAGLIEATGQESYAILGDMGDTTLNLLPGSRIIGRIDLGGGVDTVNILSANAYSATLTFANTEQFNLRGAPGLVVGSTVMLVDPTAPGIQGTLISSIAVTIHDALRQRSSRPTPPPVQVAARQLTPGLYPAQQSAEAWAEVFGADQHRGEDGMLSSFDHDYYGFMGGLEKDFGQHHLGFFGGAARSDAHSSGHSFSGESDVVFAGGYGHWQLAGMDLTASVIAGASDHDSERRVYDNLNGLERAHADFDAYFLSPSLTLACSHELSKHVTLRPSASLTYSLAWQESYRESGTTQSNLHVEDRTLRVLDARAQLAALYQLSQQGELEVRAALTSRHGNDDHVHASLAGTDFRFSAAADDHVLGGLLGASLRLPIGDRLSLVADAEYARAESDERTWQVAAMLRYAF